MKKNLIQAYKQAPWRIQLQWIGLFLLGLVLVSAITGVYLNISAQAATAGRKIQLLETNVDEINNEISVLTTELANAKSAEIMLSKAEKLGFKLIDPQQAVYLKIPGYAPQDNLVLAPPRVNIISEAPILRPSYKTSIWDWFVEKIWQTTGVSTQPLGEVQP